VLLIMGPTASGKTQLSSTLAQRYADAGIAVEIVSVDSAQVYRGMDIGTAKPDAALRAALPHHLIDILDPAEAYSAARFREDAVHLIGDIRRRGRVPMLVGGTMLYFRALTQGFSELPSASPELRARLAAEARRLGWSVMHQRLQALDPQTASRLHPNDAQRIQRALEVIEISGRPMSGLQDGVERKSGLRFIKLALNPPERGELHRRIEARFRAMMAHGLLEEVACLHARKDLTPELPSIRAVGYRQLWKFLDGTTSSLTEAEQQAIAATRQFAKRQLTWLRSEHDLCWINPDAPDATQQAWNLATREAREVAC
jgi:tRNA dimethylallyltransferase